jgi:hypothetical protein
MPVSELEQVKIEVVRDETSDSLNERLRQRIQPDLNGFCNWNLQIPAYSQVKVIFVYKIDAAPDVEGL